MIVQASDDGEVLIQLSKVRVLSLSMALAIRIIVGHECPRYICGDNWKGGGRNDGTDVVVHESGAGATRLRLFFLRGCPFD